MRHEITKMLHTDFTWDTAGVPLFFPERTVTRAPLLEATFVFRRAHNSSFTHRIVLESRLVNYWDHINHFVGTTRIKYFARIR